MMTVRSIACQNFKGFESFNLQCGNIVLVTGRNGEGKTSIAEILLAAFSSRGDRNLLREGAEEGWIEVVLADDEQDWKIRRLLKPGEVSQPKVRGSKTGAKGAPVKWLEEIVDLVSMNVLRRAMTASPEKQMEILLQTLPLKIDWEAIQTAVAYCHLKLPESVIRDSSKQESGLEAIRLVRDHLYEERTGIRRMAEDKARTVRELSEGTGAADTTDYEATLLNLRSEHTRLSNSIASFRAEEERRLSADVQEVNTGSAQRRQKLKDDAAARIQAIKDELAGDLASVDEDEREDIKTLNAESAETVRRETAGLAEQLERTKTAITQSEGLQKSQYEKRSLLELIKRTELEGTELAQKVQNLTAGLECLDGLKEGLLEKLPIKGLTFQGTQGRYNGVPIEELNTAAAAKFWIQVAVIRASERDLAVIVLDDLEKFDDIHFPVLLEQAKASGMQFFIARREDHPLKIETF